MSIIARQMLCPASKKSIKFPYEMTPTRIVVHNTANDATAQNEIKYMCNNNNEVSFHFAVDDKEVVQGLPLNVNAWHAGDGNNGKGNREGIAIEICYSKSGGSKFIAAEKLAAKFIAQLLDERKWGIDKVTKHQDYNGKYCPHRTLDMGWDRFLNMIKAEMSAYKTTTTTTVQINKNDIVKLASNATYYNGKAIPGWVKNTNWCVAEVSGDRAVINKSADGKYSINSPVNVKYLTVVKTSTSTNSQQSTSNKTNTTTTTTKPANTTISAAAAKVKVNDVVKLSSDAKYTNGTSVPSWVKNINWYVSEVSGDRVVINKSVDGKYSINSAVSSKYITVVSASINKTTATNTTTTTTTAQKIVPGKQVVLNKCPLYASSSSLFSSRKLTGTYYLWDANVVKNRIRITNSKSNVGKAAQITGWIKTSDVK